VTQNLPVTHNARQVALLALQEILAGAHADVALNKFLRRSNLNSLDRSLTTELVYGCTRRRRTLDQLIEQMAKKAPDRQAVNLRLILHLGLYQLRYLSQIPQSAAVNTTVDLSKQYYPSALSGFVNGLLRRYVRCVNEGQDPLQLPKDPVMRLGIQHSYPDWIVQTWLTQFGLEETEQLCDWLNQPPTIDLRINPLQTSLDEVESTLKSVGVRVSQIPYLPQALRLGDRTGAIDLLPGFDQGWWTVQDSSAQLVGHVLDPHPDEIVIDACAAPGGKTTHIAELMGDRGLVRACDRSPNRLKKLQENIDRLQLKSIQIVAEDSRLAEFTDQADRVLLDAPCSGLGTLHRHADARWQQTAANVQVLAQLQTELLKQTATWVKPGGVLVYATCTLHPDENEAIVQTFLATHPQWQIELPDVAAIAAFATPQGWLKVLPSHYNMDGFFIVRLRQQL
jgi:16S rRNA (cytosine967-C5)-methyltransferase